MTKLLGHWRQCPHAHDLLSLAIQGRKGDHEWDLPSIHMAILWPKNGVQLEFVPICSINKLFEVYFKGDYTRIWFKGVFP